MTDSVAARSQRFNAGSPGTCAGGASTDPPRGDRQVHQQYQRSLIAVASLAALACLVAVRSSVAQAGPCATAKYSDSHFHLTNYIQEGHRRRQTIVRMMGTASAARRCSAFRCSRSGTTATPATSRRRTTCRRMRRSTTTRSPMRRSRWPTGRCRRRSRRGFDPMITGFNPADMYAADHIAACCTMFPGVFSGIGEFTVHKEFVSPKIAGGAASLTESRAGPDVWISPARSGSSRSCTTTSTCRSRSRIRSRTSSTQLKALFARHPGTTIIWAHAGLGRIVRPVKDRRRSSTRALADPALKHVYFDISWDEIAKYLDGDARSDRGDGGPHQQISRPFPVRHRRRRADEHRCTDGGLRSVRAALGRAHARGERARCVRATTSACSTPRA